MTENGRPLEERIRDTRFAGEVETKIDVLGEKVDDLVVMVSGIKTTVDRWGGGLAVVVKVGAIAGVVSTVIVNGAIQIVLFVWKGGHL